MKVKKMISLLEKESPDAEILVWMSREDGWELAPIGVDDVIIGRNYGKDYPCENEYVLLLVEVPEVFEPWAKIDGGNNADN